MRSEAIKGGWFAWLVAIFLITFFQDHVLAAESKPGAGNAFSQIKPAEKQVRESFNIRKNSTIVNVDRTDSSPSVNAKVAKDVKRFGKLSLILSTELTKAKKQPISARSPTHVLKTRKGGEVRNEGLNELNAQIESLEATIKNQQLQLANKAPENPLSKRSTFDSDSSSQALKQSQSNSQSDTVQENSVQQNGVKQKGSWLAFGLVVLILVVVMVLFLMRKQKPEPYDLFENDQIAIKINDESDETQGSALMPSDKTEDKQSNKHPNDDDSIETLHSILPPEYEMLEEADIYLRFGHDKLAEEALREAIKINPQNSQAYLTLLRIYFSRDDAEGFLELAQQVKSLEIDGVWSKVAEMGQKLDEGNVLYQ